MEDGELERLMADLEADRAERKESFAGDAPATTREAVCAFANDLPDHNKPGVVFVGARDDGTPSGLPITDELLRRLSDMRSDGNILPFPTLTVEKRSLGGCDVAVVIVQPSYDPPIRYKGRVWIRVGPRRAVATAEEERRLTEKRRSGDLPWDLRPIRPSTIDDLDMVLFERVYLPAAVAPDVLAANDRPLEQQLAAARFVTPDGVTPTALGILVVGRDPLYYIPGSYVQFVRFGGPEMTDPILDQRVVGGPVPDMMRGVDEIIRANIRVPIEVGVAPVELRYPEYPDVAICELVRNAVMHRAYEDIHSPSRLYWFPDRVEVISAGGPYGAITPSNFGQPGLTSYRNQHLAEAMKSLGLVQRFGMVLLMARQAMDRNGNPPLEFNVSEQLVIARARRAERRPAACGSGSRLGA